MGLRSPHGGRYWRYASFYNSNNILPNIVVRAYMEDGEQPELGESGYAAVGWLSAAGGEPEALQVLIDAGATVCAVLANLVPILWESGIGSDVMKPIAAPIVGDLITSIIHVLILVPLFFVMLKERELKKETLRHLAPADQQHQLTTTTT